jgi:hypothetical protein
MCFCGIPYQNCRYRFENNRVVEDSSAEVDDLLVAHRRSSRGGGTKGSLDLSSKSSFRQLRERQRAHVQQFMATEDALNQAAQAKKLSDELIRRIHGAADGADAAVSMVTKDGAQNAGSLRQFEGYIVMCVFSPPADLGLWIFSWRCGPRSVNLQG